jgi:hypothetical protein
VLFCPEVGKEGQGRRKSSVIRNAMIILMYLAHWFMPESHQRVAETAQNDKSGDLRTGVQESSLYDR